MIFLFSYILQLSRLWADLFWGLNQLNLCGIYLAETATIFNVHLSKNFPKCKQLKKFCINRCHLQLVRCFVLFLKLFSIYDTIVFSGGQTITDRLTAARHALAGSQLGKTICKATTEELTAPKKKHLDCKF